MKCIVFLADGFEEIEALTPVDYLRRAGQEVYTVAVPSKTMNDPYIVIGSHKIPVIADLSMEEFKEQFSDEIADLVFCPGGMVGSQNLALSKEVGDYVKKANDSKKIIAAICAAPAVVFAKLGVLQGRNWTCYPNMEQDTAQYVGDMALTEKLMKNSTHHRNVPFVTDGNVVTGRGAGAAEEFAMELVRLTAGEETQLKVKAATVQR